MSTTSRMFRSGGPRKSGGALLFTLMLGAALAGCAASRPAPETTIDTTPGLAPLARPESAAVAGLMESARADAAAGRLDKAAASLERALRIEPRNPRLWQELARVRFQEGDYLQAEHVAARSSAWAGGDAGLRAENWRLIAQARQARGDAAGARDALEAAERR
jgi:tetratricopeptide (TPR) repeat protein